MKQFNGLVVGGPANGVVWAASHPTMTWATQEPMKFSDTPPTPFGGGAPEIQYHDYYYLEHEGLGFWLEKNVVIESESDLIVVLYRNFAIGSHHHPRR